MLLNSCKHRVLRETPGAACTKLESMSDNACSVNEYLTNNGRTSGNSQSFKLELGAECGSASPAWLRLIDARAFNAQGIAEHSAIHTMIDCITSVFPYT